jgi:hypothetical protein
MLFKQYKRKYSLSISSLTLLAMVFPFACIATNILPSWATQPTPDTAEHLYGIGSAKSFDGAKNNALSEIASKFNVQVEAMFISLERVNNNVATNNIQIDTKVRVQPTALNNFGVSQSEIKDDLYWVEVKLDRIKLAHELTQTWSSLDTTLQSQIRRLKNSGSLQALISISAVSASLAHAKVYLTQINFADPSKPTSQSFVRYQAYTRQLLSIPQRIDVRLNAENIDPQIMTLIGTALTSKGVRLNANKAESKIDNALPISVLTIAVNREDSQGQRNAYISQLDIQLTTRDYSGKVLIGINSFSAKGRDYEKPERAFKKALGALKGKLSRLTLLDILNIEPIN